MYYFCVSKWRPSELTSVMLSFVCFWSTAGQNGSSKVNCDDLWCSSVCLKNLENVALLGNQLAGAKLFIGPNTVSFSRSFGCWSFMCWFLFQNKDIPIENTTDCLSTMASICRVMIENPYVSALCYFWGGIDWLGAVLLLCLVCHEYYWSQA